MSCQHHIGLLQVGVCLLDALSTHSVLAVAVAWRILKNPSLHFAWQTRGFCDFSPCCAIGGFEGEGPSPTFILTIIWYSITHSLFHSKLKTFLFCKSFPLQPFLFLLQYSLHGFPGLFTVIFEHICFLLLVFLFFTLFSCRFRAVD